MSSSNWCFLTCIQVSQELGKVVWYSHLLKNFPQFVVIHTVKGFSIVNEAEVDVFSGISCFFYNPMDVGNLISGFFAFGLLWWLRHKESSCSAGNLGLIPGSRRSPEEGNVNPLQYCCLENSIDRRACQTTVHGVAKSWTWLSKFHFTSLPFLNPPWTCGSAQFICCWSLHWRI